MAREENNINFNYLKEYVTALFPVPDLPSCVDEAEQQKEVDLLKETIGSERFFFTVDLKNFEIRERAGIQRWLGYSENSFTLNQYWDIVHPGKRNGLMLVALELYKTLCTGKYALNFMVQRYSSMVAIKHRNGYYLSAKKTSSVFQYDKENRLTSYLNEFTIIGPYTGTESQQRTFFTKYGDAEIQKGGEVMKAVLEHFMEMKVFSPNELQAARKIAYEPGITQKTIAAQFNVQVSTVDTFCKRFLTKARKFFNHHFNTVVEAALFMKNEGLL